MSPNSPPPRDTRSPRSPSGARDIRDTRATRSPRGSRLRALRRALLALLVLAAAAFIFEYTRPFRDNNPLDAFVDDLIGRDWADFEDPDFRYVELPDGADLAGLLVVSQERDAYVDSAMVLILPALTFHKGVSDGVTREALRGRPGLFEMSDMPGAGDRNVSIAAHRDHSGFYYLDRVDQGDRVYLAYDGIIFTYLFYDRTVASPSDWSVVGKQGFSCCTLITCTPIRVASHRMVLRFILESVEEDTEARRAAIIDW